MTTMIVDETPPRSNDENPAFRIDAANDNGPDSPSSIDPRILVIARAIGRLIAREQASQHKPANDNSKDDTHGDAQ